MVFTFEADVNVHGELGFMAVINNKMLNVVVGWQETREELVEKLSTGLRVALASRLNLPIEALKVVDNDEVEELVNENIAQKFSLALA
jgi:hypothetical protein